ncbi:MAG: oligosaccharide flippase family protein [candidate division Zixibacteria bacterium]|nr:oligosaccharide flippase family protein [candidate division Zixibacteria bacterium]
MRIEMKDFARNSSIYFISNLINKGISFFLFAYIARAITVEQMGQYNLYLLLATIFTLFLSLEIQSGYTRFYFDMKRAGKRDAFEHSLINLLLLANIILGILFWISRDTIFGIFYNIPDATYLLIIFFPFFTSVSSIILAKFRLEERAFELAVVSLLQNLANLVFVISLLSAMSDKVFIIICGMLIMHGVIIFYYAVRYIRSWSFRIDFSLVKESLRFSSFLCVSTMGAYFLSMTDRYMLEKLETEKSVGYYSAFSRLASTVELCMLPFYNAFAPKVYREYQREGFRKVYYSMLIMVSAILLLQTNFLTLFNKELTTLILSSKYIDYYYVLYILVLGYAFKSMSYYLAMNIHLSKKTQYDIVVEVSSGIINILLNILLIIQIGLIGAVIATVISYFIRLTMYLFYANRFFKRFYLSYVKIGSFIAALLSFTWFHYTLFEQDLPIKIGIYLLELFAVVFIFLRVVDNRYREILLTKLKSIPTSLSFHGRWTNLSSNKETDDDSSSDKERQSTKRDRTPTGRIG